MMKKNKTPVLLILTVLLTLLLSSTAFAGRWEYAGNGWTPNDKYCKWGDNFRFDHAFKFHNAKRCSLIVGTAWCFIHK